jgi:hypothetical protein
MCAGSHLTTKTNSATKYFRPEGTMFNELYYLYLCNKTIYLLYLQQQGYPMPAPNASMNHAN